MYELSEWLEEFTADRLWYVKRLSANDTLANGSHQSGIYLPRPVFFRLFPDLESQTHENADARIRLTVHSHSDTRNARVIWYNNRLRGGTRNEVRVTNLGGGTSALLDPDSTGALAVLAFRAGASGTADSCDVWVCRDGSEEDEVERKTGPVEPGRWKIWPPDEPLLRRLGDTARKDCRLRADELPPRWLQKFPSGREIIGKVLELRSDEHLSVDRRIMRRRACEFDLFSALEEAVELPRAQSGFESVAGFLEAAQKVLQRRKARSGRSLELHVRELLLEEGFREGEDFTYQPRAGNNPDFLFPSEAAYTDPAFARERIRMLAVKTTLRDRWRQVTEECPDLPVKHLLTLQEGVSEAQFRLIREAGIRLVVPEERIRSYKSSIRPELLTVEKFLAGIRQV